MREQREHSADADPELLLLQYPARSKVCITSIVRRARQHTCPLEPASCSIHPEHCHKLGINANISVYILVGRIQL